MDTQLFLLANELDSCPRHDVNSTRNLRKIDIVPERIVTNVRFSDISHNEYLLRNILRCFDEYADVARIIVYSKTIIKWAIDGDRIFQLMSEDKYTVPEKQQFTRQEEVVWTLPISRQQNIQFVTSPRDNPTNKWVLDTMSKSNTISGKVTPFTRYHFHASRVRCTTEYPRCYRVMDFINELVFTSSTHKKNITNEIEVWLKNNITNGTQPASVHITLGRRQIRAIVSHILSECNHNIKEMNNMYHTSKLYKIIRTPRKVNCPVGNTHLLSKIKYHEKCGGSLVYPPAFNYGGKPPLYHMLSNKMYFVAHHYLKKYPDALTSLQNCDPKSRHVTTEWLIKSLKKSRVLHDLFFHKP